MDITNQIEHFTKLAKLGIVEFYEGVDGHEKPLVKRIEIAESPIRQTINGETVAKFHKKTNQLVLDIILKRVEKNLDFMNMIRQEDKHLEIELSNPKKLKEARLLPRGFEIDGMIATFGSYTSITSLNEEKVFGVIIKDETITRIFNSMFESL